MGQQNPEYEYFLSNIYLMTVSQTLQYVKGHLPAKQANNHMVVLVQNGYNCYYNLPAISVFISCTFDIIQKKIELVQQLFYQDP